MSAKARQHCNPPCCYM